MNKVLNKYFESVETHRRLVWQVGMLFTGRISLDQLAIHDLSKYSDEEFRAYAERGYGDKNESFVYQNLRMAWQHHLQNNFHHWQHWIITPFSWPVKIKDDIDFNGAIPMPSEYVIEMVIDWQTMEIQHWGRQDMSKWLRNNFDKTILHKDTRSKAIEILEEIGYRLDLPKVNSEFTLDDTTPLAAEIEKIVIQHKSLNVKD